MCELKTRDGYYIYVYIEINEIIFLKIVMDVRRREEDKNILKVKLVVVVVVGSSIAVRVRPRTCEWVGDGFVRVRFDSD